MTAIVTASYTGDFERCRLLCESLDKHLKGHWTHYILVDEIDVDLFRQLAGPNRIIVSERELFPWWLRSFPDPVSSRHSRIWLSPFSLPLRGWHAQQIRRFAIAEKLSEDVMLSIDSDVVLIKDFDVNSLKLGDDIRFYRRESQLDDSMQEHLRWSKNAGALLSINSLQTCNDDYINTFIAWRVETVRKLLAHISDLHGTHWVKSLIKKREMSECMIYGRFVDEIENGAYHQPNSQSLCHVIWDEKRGDTSTHGIEALLSNLAPEQVAIGIQSFVNADLQDIRKAISKYHTV